MITRLGIAVEKNLVELIKRDTPSAVRVKALTDSEFHEIVSEKMPNAGLYRSLRKGPVMTRMIAKQVFYWGESHTADKEYGKAIALYTKMVSMPRFKGTAYARRAYKLLGDIYTILGQPYAVKAVACYRASLNAKRPALNLPQYYILAQYYDADATKPPSPTATAYYALLHKGFREMTRIYATKRVWLSFSDKGYGRKDPKNIIKGLMRLVESYNAGRKVTELSRLILDLKPLFSVDRSPDDAQKKIFLASANAFHAQVVSALAAGKPAQAIDALKGLAHLALLLESDGGAKIDAVFAKTASLLRKTAAKYMKLKKYDAAQEIMRWMSCLLICEGTVIDEQVREYTDLIKVRNKRGEYAKAYAAYTMAKRIAEETIVKPACTKLQFAFGGCVDEKLNMIPELNKLAIVGLSHSYLATLAKARQLATSSRARDRARAAMYAALSRTQFARTKKLFDSIGPKDNDYAATRLKLAGLYELAGKAKEAAAVYRSVAKLKGLADEHKHQAAFRLALIEGRYDDAKKALKGRATQDSYHSALLLAKRMRKTTNAAGGALVHVVNNIAIRRIADCHALYNITTGALLATVRGANPRLSKEGIEFPSDRAAGRSFKVVFTSTDAEVIDNYDALVAVMEKVPAGIYAKLRKITFTGKVLKEEAGHYLNRTITIHRHENGQVAQSIVHEMGHLWDDMNSRSMRLFRSISWKGSRKREHDERDFMGGCSDPKGFKYGAVRSSKTSVPKMLITCTDPKKIPYGMFNSFEDFATSAEKYFGGSALRKKANAQLGTSYQKANIEPIVKYLFVKYHTPFAGKEYNNTKADPRINLVTIEERLRSWFAQQPGAAHVKRGLKLLHRIKYTKAFYRIDGDAWRLQIRDDMAAGKFKDAVRYLYLKYKKFRKKEFGVAGNNTGLTAAEVKKALDAWITKGNDVKRRTARTIRKYARRYER